MAFKLVVESMENLAVKLGIMKEVDTLKLLQAQGNKICGSSGDCVLMFNQSTSNITLFDVLTATIAKLPQIPSLTNKNQVVHKAVLSSGYSGTHYYRIVMAIYGEKKELASYNLGTKIWRMLKEAGTWYDDVICHEEELYAVDEYGKVVHYQIDYDHNVRELVSRWFFGGQKVNLVVVDDELCLIIRYFRDTPGSCRQTNLLKVYMLNDDYKFVKLADLGRWAILLGQTQAAALPARSTDGLRPNYIYFRDYCMHKNDQLRDMRGFCMEDKYIEPMQEGANNVRYIWQQLYLG